MPTFFDGQYLVTPTVVTAIDDSAMYPNALPTGNVLALIGPAGGGAPKTPIRLRSPDHARQVFRSGPLYEAALRAFSPSSATGAPGIVLGVRVDPATQATATLKNATNANIITLKSADYGAHTNAIEVKLEAASDVGFRVSVRQNGAVYSRDNIGAEVFSALYTGTEATATVAVAGGKLTLEAPTGTVIREYVLADWSSAAALVEAMQSLTDWTVTLTDRHARFLPERLDALTAANAKTELKLTGHAWAVYDFFNAASEILVNAEWAATLPVAAPKVTGGWVALSGAVTGNTATADWEDAFAALHEIEAHWIVPLSDSAAIWDLASAHCDFMSSNKRERRAFVGGGTGVTDTQAMADALAINSDRVGYVWPGIYDPNPTGRGLVLHPAYMAAVHVAAGFAAINPGETMSRKAISVAGVEALLREPTDTDALLEAGVIPLVQTERGVIVSQSVSTWLMDDRYNRREVSVGAAVDYVARAVRASLEQFLGQRGSAEVIPRARNRLESILADLAAPPPMGLGVLVGDAGSPAYRNIDITLDGDILRVAFECSPVIPINYVLVGISVTPFRSTTA